MLLCSLSRTPPRTLSVHPAADSAEGLLFPSARSATFRSAICSHRAQLFLKPLCIYMSAPRPPSAGAHSVQRDASGGPRARTEEENESKGRAEEDTAGVENLLHAPSATRLWKVPSSCCEKGDRGRERRTEDGGQEEEREREREGRMAAHEGETRSR